MSLKISLMEIRGLVQPLKKLSNQELPIKTSWKLLRISEQVETLYQKIEEFRVQLVTKYGEKTFEVTLKETSETKTLNEAEYESSDKNLFSGANPKLEIRDNEKLNDFAKEFEELLRTEETLDIEPIPVNDLGENTKISPQELFFLQKILA
jgi:hypothetical protein